MNDKLDPQGVPAARPEPDRSTGRCHRRIGCGSLRPGHQIVWLKDTGELVGVSKDALLEIIAKYVVTKQLVPHGDRWRVEYEPHVPDEMTVRAVLMGEGGLAQRLPKAASEPTRLSDQQQKEVHARLKIGERPDSLARAYGVPIEAIRQLVPGQ